MKSSPRSRTVIVDYGTGNLNSVKRALDRIGANCLISLEPKDIENADKIVLPGVGHFGRAMETLKTLDLIEPLNEAVCGRGKPILGICLGMEVMAKSSEEGDASGLGWIDAELIKFQLPHSPNLKVPHMGWNEVRLAKPSKLFADVAEDSEFYFAHSYHLRLNDPADLLTETDYGITFPSALEKDNIFGVQYHPEKSHDAGAQVLKNFVEM